MADGYLKRRRNYQDISGSLAVLAATDDTTLQAVRSANYTIFIQRLIVTITAGSAGKTWTFKDSAGTPVPIANAVDASTAGQFTFDFGADGVALSAGKDFLLDVSAAGAAGQVTWQGYQKLTSVINTGTANTAN